MGKYTFACPQCGARLTVPADAVGKRCKCVSCGNLLTVPGPAPAEPVRRPAGPERPPRAYEPEPPQAQYQPPPPPPPPPPPMEPVAPMAQPYPQPPPMAYQPQAQAQPGWGAPAAPPQPKSFMWAIRFCQNEGAIAFIRICGWITIVFGLLGALAVLIIGVAQARELRHVIGVGGGLAIIVAFLAGVLIVYYAVFIAALLFLWAGIGENALRVRNHYDRTSAPGG